MTWLVKGDLWPANGDCEMWTCFCFFWIMCHTNSKADKPVTHTFTTDTHTKAHTHTHTYPYWKYIHVHPCNKFSSSCFWIWCVYIYIWIIQVDKGIMLYYDNISIFVLLNCTVKLPPPFHYSFNDHSNQYCVS